MIRALSGLLVMFASSDVDASDIVDADERLRHTTVDLRGRDFQVLDEACSRGLGTVSVGADGWFLCRSM
jgi:hypothetical protein